MRLSDLGEPIAVGRTAEVFALGDDRVVKLLRPGFDPQSLEGEVRKATLVTDAGVAAPKVLDQVEIDGRAGIVFERVEGDLLVDDIAIEPMRLRHWGHLFANAHADVMAHRAPGLAPVTERLHNQVDATDLDDHTKSVVHGQLDVLSGGDTVLHGDFHPANLMLSPEGIVPIDWVDAARGAPAADIARTSWLLSSVTVSPDLPQRGLMVAMQGSFRRTYLRRVTRALGVSRRELAAWRLPVVAARIAEDIPSEDAALRAEVSKLVARF